MTERVRVLHVEGDSALAQQAGTWIARNVDALDVTVVQTPNEGMEHLDGRAVDCVVAACSSLDDVLELLSHVRETDPALPFIFVSENGDTAVAEAVRTDEATEYVAADTEVPQFDELADRIHEAVARTDMTDEGLETSLHGIDDDLESLERLHEATNRLYGAESVQECHEITIDTAVSILGFDWCMLGEADEDLGRYRVRAASPGSPLEVGDVSIAIDEGLIGHAFATGESHVVDDVTDDDRAQPAREAIRSVLSVPVDGWGVL